MKTTEQEQRVLARVIEMLGSEAPANEDLQDYIIGYGVLGKLISSAQLEYEAKEMERKLAYADAFKTAKLESKASDAMARELAYLATEEEVKAEQRAKQQLSYLRATRETVQETIWAIKYLGKQDGAIGYGT